MFFEKTILQENVPRYHGDKEVFFLKTPLETMPVIGRYTVLFDKEKIKISTELQNDTQKINTVMHNLSMNDVQKTKDYHFEYLPPYKGKGYYIIRGGDIYNYSEHASWKMVFKRKISSLSVTSKDCVIFDIKFKANTIIEDSIKSRGPKNQMVEFPSLIGSLIWKKLNSKTLRIVDTDIQDYIHENQRDVITGFIQTIPLSKDNLWQELADRVPVAVLEDFMGFSRDFYDFFSRNPFKDYIDEMSRVYIQKPEMSHAEKVIRKWCLLHFLANDHIRQHSCDPIAFLAKFLKDGESQLYQRYEQRFRTASPIELLIFRLVPRITSRNYEQVLCQFPLSLHEVENRLKEKFSRKCKTCK